MITRDHIHSYQQRHLLLRAQIYLFDGGTGWEPRPFASDCRRETEALLDRIHELLQVPLK